MSAESQRRQLGEVLVERGVLTEDQLQLALAEQQRTGAPLGEVVVQLGFSIGPVVGNALAEQHGGPLRTEYGFALGVPSKPSARDGTTRATERAATSRQQDLAIARLTTALHERTQELEQARSELGAAKHNQAGLPEATAELERLQRELAEVGDERARAQQALELALAQHEVELAAVKAELAAQQDALADTQPSDELRRVLTQRNAELTRVREERTDHANRVADLERQLVEALNAPRIPELTPEPDDANPVDELDQYVEQAPAREDETAGDTAVPVAKGITVRLWHLALFIALVPVLLYVLGPVRGMLAVALLVLLAAVALMFGRRTSPAEKNEADGAPATPVYR